jgi:hypothetical protein
MARVSSNSRAEAWAEKRTIFAFAVSRRLRPRVPVNWWSVRTTGIDAPLSQPLLS